MAAVTHYTSVHWIVLAPLCAPLVSLVGTFSRKILKEQDRPLGEKALVGHGCRQWVQNTRRQDLLHRTTEYLSKNCRFCSEHFELDQFSNKQTKNKPNWNAVPTLFDIPNPPKHLSSQRRIPKRKNENLSSAPKPSKHQIVIC